MSSRIVDSKGFISHILGNNWRLISAEANTAKAGLTTSATATVGHFWLIPRRTHCWRRFRP
jgi:hypothetical protein